MGEVPLLEVARRLASGEDICGLTDVRGTEVRFRDAPEQSWRALAGEPDREEIWLPTYEEICADKQVYAEFSRLYHLEHNPDNARILVQKHGGELVYVNPPAQPPATEMVDWEYELPFTRLPHPMYGEARIPAWEQIRFSVTIMRRCEAGVRGQRRALRSGLRRRGARGRVHPRAGGKSRRRAPQDRPGAHLARRGPGDEEAGQGAVRPVQGAVREVLRRVGQGAVPGALLHLRPSRLRGEGHGGAVRLPGGERLAAPAGAGLHAHADDAGDRHVLLWLPPEHGQADS